MGISIPGRVVVFDYGEVISQAPDARDRQALVELAGVPASLLWPAYERRRDELDEGTLGIVEYWRDIAEELGVTWDAARIHRLWVTDYRSWLSIDPGTLGVLVDLAAGDTRLALLSNAGRDFGSYFRHGSLGGLFEAVFVSGELGVIKPSRVIFETAMRELGITAAQTVFVDNKEINVRGAEALGITGHVFTGADALRAFLSTLES